MIAVIERIFLSPEPHDTLTLPRRTRYFHVLHVCQLFPASWRVAPHTRPRPHPHPAPVPASLRAQAARLTRAPPQAPLSTCPQSEPLVLESAWSKAHQLCGGSPKKGNPDWWRNPQFRLQLVTGERTQARALPCPAGPARSRDAERCCACRRAGSGALPRPRLSRHATLVAVVELRFRLTDDVMC